MNGETLYKMVSIDPGIKHTAFAVWDRDSRLVAAEIVPNGDALRDSMQATLQTYRAVYCAVETQFKAEGSAVKTADLIALAYWAGRAAEASHTNTKTLVTPNQWKRGAPKRISCVASWERLHQPERNRVGPVLIRTLLRARSRTKTVPDLLRMIRADRLSSDGVKQCTDILDAIGIGLWALNRSKRGLVPSFGQPGDF